MLDSTSNTMHSAVDESSKKCLLDSGIASTLWGNRKDGRVMIYFLNAVLTLRLSDKLFEAHANF